MSELPLGWTSTTLQVATKVIRGITFPSTAKESAPTAENVCCLRTANIQKDVTWGDVYYVSRQYVKRDEQLVQVGDILMSMANSYELVGKVAHVKSVPSPTAFGAFLSAVRPTPVIDGRYLFHFLRSDRVQLELREGSSQTTNIANISVGKLNTIEVPLAPMSEQTRIADQLDKLLARIQACNERIDAIPTLLKRFRQTVLDAATSDALTEDWQTASSANWRPVQLADVASDFSYGSAAKSSKIGAVPVLRMGNIQSGRLDWSDLVYTSDPHEIDKYKLTKGDVLFNRTNSPELVGKTAVYQGERDAIYAGYLIRVRCSPALLPEYLNYCLGSKAGRAYCWSVKSDGVSQSNINAKKLAAFRFSLPSLEEQAEIVRRVEALFKLADRIEARYMAARAQAQRLTPLLLAKAFRGELVQQDPQAEPASVLLGRIAATKPAKTRTSSGQPRIQKRPSAIPELDPIDWASLPNGAWAAPADPDGQAATVWLTAVLRAWGEPMPEREARLAVMLCQQPRLFAAVLPAAQATEWSRLVGDEARPLPTQVLPFQSAINGHWARAIKSMRARDDLVETDLGDGVTWALGPGAASIETIGWPDGRAGFVAAYLRAHGIASVLPLLEPSAQEFVDARAA